MAGEKTQTKKTKVDKTSKKKQKKMKTSSQSEPPLSPKEDPKPNTTNVPPQAETKQSESPQSPPSPIKDQTPANTSVEPHTETTANKKKDKKQKKDNSLKETNAKTYISLKSAAEDNKKVKAPSYSDAKDRGLVYISHVPHGFYEKQMREFFSQFGTVTNLRLGRSRKTGRSKGFAFVEFKYQEVAKIAADSMNNYLMFDKIVKCELVPQERRSPAVFKGKIMPHRPPGKTAMFKAKKVNNAEKTDEQNQKRQVRQMAKLEKIREKLEKAGVTYSFQVAEMIEKPEESETK